MTLLLGLHRFGDLWSPGNWMFEDLVSPSQRVYLEEGRNANLPALQKGTLVPLPPPFTGGAGIWDLSGTGLSHPCP